MLRSAAAPETNRPKLTRQRVLMRMWFARLFGSTGSQMLLVAALWVKGFPALAQRDRMSAC